MGWFGNYTTTTTHQVPIFINVSTLTIGSNGKAGEG
jgi:hypothetical protein